MINEKNRRMLLLSLLFIALGILVLSWNFLKSKKLYTFDTMNIMLYENVPEYILAKNMDEMVENDDIEDLAPSSETTTVVDRYYTGILEIPKINLKKGFYNIGHYLNNINSSITVLEGSSMPDVEHGNLMLAAHNGNAAISFFGKLHKLDVGDEAYVYYNKVKYVYKIVKIYDIEKTGTAKIIRTTDKTALTMITCKEGTNYEQVVYIAELQDSYEY